jgi:hypothetical protein
MGLKAGIVVAIVVLASIWLGIHAYMNWTTTIENYAKVKVGLINYGYDVFSGSHETEVVGVDGTEQLQFWDNQTGLFLPYHSYALSYHTEYRGWICPIGNSVIDSIKEINGTSP